MHITNAPQPQNRRQPATTLAGSLVWRLALSFALVVPALTAPMLVGVGLAYAACVSSSPPLSAGDSVICSGSQTTSLGDGTQDNITVTVLQGADITVGAGQSAIRLDTGASIANFGTISGDNNGVDADAIDSLTNSGTIRGDDNGIYVDDDVTSLTNSGTIRGDRDGIYVAHTITFLTNSGTINGGEDGVEADTITALTNSGTIRGGIFAIQETGSFGVRDTVLTLNAGSVLIGRVDLGGGTNTLNIGEGLSLNSTFESNGGATLAQLGTTDGHLVALVPVVINGNNEVQVVAVDPSAFANFDDALAALTSGIGQTVQGRQSALRSDPALNFANRYAAAEETSLAAFSDLDLNDAPHLNPNRFWIEGFGAYREDDSDRVGSTFESLTGGLVAGIDVPLDALTSVGIMAGFAASTSENEIDTQETDTMSYYGGVYASTQALGLAWDASLTVGYTDYDQERITANNLVAGGLETASANFGGWFINPQVTATNSTPTGFTSTAMGFGLASIEQSLTLSYAGLFLDGAILRPARPIP